MKSVTKAIMVAMVAIIAGVAITSCKGPKSVQSASNEVTVPLSGKEYQTDKDYFRATQSGKSPDLATAKKIALQNARTELSAAIQSTVKAVIESYTNQRSVGDKQEYEAKFEEQARTVVNQSLSDVRTIGEKIFKEEGKYTYYVAIEMSKVPIVNNVADRISKDAKLQLDFDQHQFRKVFDEEMQKMEQSRE
jgi:hypothetical protein